MKNKIAAVAAMNVLLLGLATPMSALAQVGTGPNPYRDCGIGAALFPTVNWAAVTSNVIWDVGTTAVTSATASPETCQGNGVKTAQFILDTYENVLEETARGSGEHLTAMLNIMGCSVAAHDSIIGSVRGDIVGSVGTVSYAAQTKLEKASQYYDAVVVASSGMCS